MRAQVSIGSYVCISDGVEILTASHALDDPDWGMIARPVVIEDYAWIATGAMILPGVLIGKGAVVGGNAFITTSVAPGSRVSGSSRTQPIPKVTE
jgi:acetyltransferase-like isoleucine patch superfamily enzyme